MGKMRLNVREVAEAAGVSKHVVHRARRSGALKAHTKGTRWFYYDLADVDRWLVSRQITVSGVYDGAEPVIVRRLERYSPTPSPSPPDPTAANPSTSPDDSSNDDES